MLMSLIFGTTIKGSNNCQALTGGEDAYFIAGETWFGVADGEGQWSLEGSYRILSLMPPLYIYSF